MKVGPTHRVLLHRMEAIGARAWLEEAAEADDLPTLLVRLLALVRCGCTVEVSAAVEHLLSLGAPADALVQASRMLRTGTLWGVGGAPRPSLLWHDLPLAVALARSAVERAPEHPPAHLALAEALLELGRTHEARRHQEEAVRWDPSLAARMAARRLNEGDPVGALALLERAPAGVQVEELLVAAAVAGFDLGAVTRERAVGIVSATELPALARGEALFALGALDAAAACGPEPAAAVALASGRDARAEELLVGASSAWASRLRAALAVRGGEAGALERLDALAGSARGTALAEVLAWRAAWRLSRGDFEGCVKDARAARAASQRVHLPARVLQVLAVARRAAGRGALHPKIWAEIDEVLADDDDRSRLDPTSLMEVEREASLLLDRFEGNLTPWPTVVEGGRAVPLAAREDPRAAAARLAGHLSCASPEAVLHDLDALARREPTSPYPWTYRGEILLWIGAYEAAAEALERAIALRRDTVWAWIGRGACWMLSGEVARALATWDEGVRACHGYEGPTLPAYRGEARWRLGDVEAARAELDVAVRRHPTRLGAHVVSALAAGVTDGEVARRARLIDLIRELAPGLAVDTDRLAAGENEVGWLHGVLHLLRGNRSSSLLTWVGEDGALRIRRSPLRGGPGT